MVNIAAWIPGRLDRLYVDYTGVTVRKRDYLVYMYSPDLVVARRELPQAWQAFQRLGTGDHVINVALAGKWVCPMHWWVVEDGPGECRQCEMPLEQAESLGLVELSPEDQAAAKEQVICPVTGELLGHGMGTPYKIDYEGRAVFLCCKMCEGKFKADPQKYLAALPK